ncbi:MAG: J domain-containing protein [Phycisphaerales bacterium]|nr:J domain-containing protein [Phycisphaerales bacterium]
MKRPIEDCFRLLGLTPAANPVQVRSAFRGLIHALHPDRSNGAFDRRRFVEVIEAYRTLRTVLALDWGAELRECPRCGRLADLLDGLDGMPGCEECLLGETRRRRLLPLPQCVTVRHAGAIGLYVGSAALAGHFLFTGQLQSAVSSLLLAVGGLGMLAATCVAVRRLH